MLFLRCATFFAVLWAYVWANGDVGDVKQMSELCPYSTFCTTGPRKQIKSDRKMSCCLPCSCSDMCTVTGNCCPDKPIVRTPDNGFVRTNRTNVVNMAPVGDPCKLQSTLYSKLLIRTIKFDQLKYRVIDRCPLEFDHNSNQCYTHKAHDVNDLVFVSDAKTKDTYLNRFCARCNGVTDVISWNLQVECPPNFLKNVTSFQERDAYIFELCDVASLPPSFDIGLHSVCYDAFSKCNETKQWNVYDHRVDELCQKYTNVYVTGDIKGNYFANIYCFLCNVQSGQLPIDLCPRIDFEGNRKDKHVVFSSLLVPNYNNLHSSVDDGDVQCTTDEVVDPFLMTCADLLCPLGLLPSHGTCTPIFDEMPAIFMQFQINIKLPRDNNSRTVHTELLMAVHSSFVQPAISAQCGFCKLDLFKMHIPRDYFADITLYTTEQCRSDALVAKIRSLLERRPLDLHLNRTNMDVTIEFEPKKIPDSMRSNLVERTSTMRCGAERHDFGWAMLPCPTIVYNPDHLLNVGVSRSVVENLTQESRNTSDGNFQICLDIYRKIKAELQSTALRPTLSSEYLFCLVLLGCVLLTH